MQMIRRTMREVRDDVDVKKHAGFEPFQRLWNAIGGMISKSVEGKYFAADYVNDPKIRLHVDRLQGFYPVDTPVETIVSHFRGSEFVVGLINIGLRNRYDALLPKWATLISPSEMMEREQIEARREREAREDVEQKLQDAIKQVEVLNQIKEMAKTDRTVHSRLVKMGVIPS